jgi:hypothetical protein
LFVDQIVPISQQGILPVLGKKAPVLSKLLAVLGAVNGLFADFVFLLLFFGAGAHVPA